MKNLPGRYNETLLKKFTLAMIENTEMIKTLGPEQVVLSQLSIVHLYQ